MQEIDEDKGGLTLSSCETAKPTHEMFFEIGFVVDQR